MTTLIAPPSDLQALSVVESPDEETILRTLESDAGTFEYDDEFFLEKHVSVDSSRVAMYIGALLTMEAANTGDSHVFNSELIYRCWPDTPRRFRKPDVSVVRADRLAPLGPDPRVMTIPADLAVEVISPTNTVDDLNRKLRQYRDAGFGPVWVVHPPIRTIDVYHPDGRTERLPDDAEISADPILPEFRRRVGELFPPR